MGNAMSQQERCKWDDVGLLLPLPEQSDYARLNCVARDDYNRLLWWLADPLYSAPGNERWVEQQWRRFAILLHSSGGSDERWNFDEAFGGDAIVALLQRYGWPTYTAWGGRRLDASHSRYLKTDFNTPPAPPYTSFEYSPGRMPGIPNLNVLRAPFESIPGDWNMSFEDSLGNIVTTKWSTEHFKPAKYVANLDEAQWAYLRRDAFTEVVLATSLNHRLLGNSRQRYSAVLVSSARPGAVDTVAQVAATAQSVPVMRGPLNSLTSVLSFEATSTHDSFRPVARLRFGSRAPAPLREMSESEVDVSLPILLDGDAIADRHQNPGDELLQAMLASIAPITTRKIGIYWESYGFNPQDTTKVVVSVRTKLEVGAARRLGMALRVTADPNSAIEIAWLEPAGEHSVTTLIGPVPVQQRLITVDLSKLVPGAYDIGIQMSLSNGRTASSLRSIEVR